MHTPFDRGPRRLLAVLLTAVLPASAAAQGSRPDSAELLSRGISETLARHRAATTRNVRYDLALDVTSLDSAVGRVTVRFRRSGPGDAIIDFRGRRLHRGLANGHPLAPDAARNGHVLIPGRLLVPGENVLDFTFAADIARSGASIIRSHDPTDGSDYLYTLLVPADASQLFPCFDQPDLKAHVSLTVTAPATWSVVANSPIVATDTTGRVVSTRFAQTRPISTYLIAFAAGPWHRVASTTGGRSITAYVRRSRAAEADLDTLIALNRRALEWMEGYFGRAYPFEKFDFVLAPAFPFGGMEHPGAVFYSEDRFIFRERPPLPRRLARYSTILHEVAHQWFGDLVTMRWFDDLWLKEGFATFMAARALADLEPEAGAWKTFYLGNKPAAYAVDQTAGTRPLWQELANLDQAKSNYGAIVYNKAPAVLKQLEYLMGDSAFRSGVRRFLDQYAYGNATWRDLLGAIGRASGQPMERFGREFMLRAGMPMVEQQVVVQDGRIARLALIQRRASGGCGNGEPGIQRSIGRLVLPHPERSEGGCPRFPGPAPKIPRSARDEVTGNDTWTERTDVLLAYRDRPTVRILVTLRGRITEVSAAVGRLAPDFVFANADDYGYFLLLLDSASVRALEQGALSRVEDDLLRAMLWGAMWDQVRASRMSPERFVRLVLRDLPGERDEQIVPAVLARLDRAVRAYLRPDARKRVQQQVEEMLWANAVDTARAYGLRKAYADAFIGLAASPRGITRLDALVLADSVAGEPLRDPTRWDVVSRLLELGAPTGERRRAQQVKQDTTPDGRRRAFIAEAGRPDSATKRVYWSQYFADSTLNEDWAMGSLGAFNTLEHEAVTLPYLGPALDSLPFIQAHRRIFFLETWLGAFLRGQTSDSALGIVRRYLKEHPRLPVDLRRKVLQHMDELERTVGIRGRVIGR